MPRKGFTPESSPSCARSTWSTGRINALCPDKTVLHLLDEYQRRVNPKSLGKANGMNPGLYALSHGHSRQRRSVILRLFFFLYTAL